MKLVASLTERTTAATDAFLSVAAAGIALYLQWLTHPPTWKINLWSWSFILIAVSAGGGAAYHGLLMAERLRRALWTVVTIAMGWAISLFVVAVLHDAGGLRAAQEGLPIMLAAGLLIFALSRIRPGLFAVFIIYEGAALLTALAVYTWLAVSGAVSGADWMAAGVATSLIAAAIQPIKRLRVALLWEFDRNGLFHLVQALGLILLGVGLSQP